MFSILVIYIGNFLVCDQSIFDNQNDVTRSIAWDLGLGAFVAGGLRDRRPMTGDGSFDTPLRGYSGREMGEEGVEGHRAGD